MASLPCVSVSSGLAETISVLDGGKGQAASSGSQIVASVAVHDAAHNLAYHSSGWFLKTMQAPPLLRTSTHTVSASCRVERPIRAVYLSLVPKARLRSFWINGFSLFSGAGSDLTVDRNNLIVTGF